MSILSKIGSKAGFLLLVGGAIFIFTVYMILEMVYSQEKNETVSKQWNYKTNQCNINEKYGPNLTSC